MTHTSLQDTFQEARDAVKVLSAHGGKLSKKDGAQIKRLEGAVERVQSAVDIRADFAQRMQHVQHAGAELEEWDIADRDAAEKITAQLPELSQSLQEIKQNKKLSALLKR